MLENLIIIIKVYIIKSCEKNTFLALPQEKQLNCKN